MGKESKRTKMNLEGEQSRLFGTNWVETLGKGVGEIIFKLKIVDLNKCEYGT